MSMEPLSTEHATPVYKVGAVVMRMRDSAAPEFFIMRTKPKQAGEQAPFALPRGSRQYFVTDAGGKQHYYDARDAATAAAHAESMEPLTRALLRELYEEAGIPRAVLRSADAVVQEMGVRLFASRSKPPYAVHWFVVQMAQAAQMRMLPHPKDAVAVQWATLEMLERMAESGDFSAGYLPVVREALAVVGTLPMVTWVVE